MAPRRARPCWHALAGGAGRAPAVRAAPGGAGEPGRQRPRRLRALRAPDRGGHAGRPTGCRRASAGSTTPTAATPSCGTTWRAGGPLMAATPPRFVPTLTEVVHSGPRRGHAAEPLSQEQLAHRVCSGSTSRSTAACARPSPPSSRAEPQLAPALRERDRGRGVARCPRLSPRNSIPGASRTCRLPGGRHGCRATPVGDGPRPFPMVRAWKLRYVPAVESNNGSQPNSLLRRFYANEVQAG
jgi:hypothetical protein